MSTSTATQGHSSITPGHLRRIAVVYIRQSTAQQVRENTGSTEFQRSLVAVARSYGWSDSQIEMIDDDLGRSGYSSEGRTGWQRVQDMIDANPVGAVFVTTISRLSRQLLDYELFRFRAAYHNTLLYTDGRFINPADLHDTLVSQISAMVAHDENRKRTEIAMQSKTIKAQRGEVVSRLPVGWIKGPDSTYDFDPETKDIIQTIIERFWQTRSIRRTVKMLANSGVQIPCRKRHGQLYFKTPTTARVTFILTHPAYTGAYVFAKTRSQPGGPVLASGRSKRIKLSQERWLRIVNHHPAYMTMEEQEEIKTILTKNQFKRRYRDGRGRLATQGLLRCAVCNATLAVSDSSRGSFFACRGLRDYAKKPCMSFCSNDLDECILREVFTVLTAPPINMLKSALEASRKKKQTRLGRIESQRARLAHEEDAAQERADLTRGALPRVHFAAQANDESEEELVELCQIAGDVPGLWKHDGVTHQERKEILRCLINHIVIAVTKERIDATIVWKSGAQTPLHVWRARSRHHLLRELHAQQLTAVEIKESLADGKTSSGQVINISVAGIRKSLNTMGLKPAKYSARLLSVRRTAAELDREGQSVEAIARYFNEQGFVSPSGKSWTFFMVEHLLHANGQKQEPLENIHRNAVTEARARGLNYREMAEEFNRKQIRRRGGRPWTAERVATRWRDLKRMGHERDQEASALEALEKVLLEKEQVEQKISLEKTAANSTNNGASWRLQCPIDTSYASATSNISSPLKH